MTRGRWGELRWALVGLLLLAWTLRLPPLLQTPLHPDEALYGYWGKLISQGRDVWLTGVPAYKPPLLPYLVAVAQLFFGDTVAALRLSGLVPGLLLVPLTGALACVLYDDPWAGAMAAVGVALSPLGVVFSGAAFPDMLMVVLGVVACLAAVRHRAGLAGLLAGLSFAAKQSGLVWLPLSLLIRCRRLDTCDGIRRYTFKLIGGWLLVAGFVFAWDAARIAQGAVSFWQAGVVGYGGLRLVWPQEMWPRLQEWCTLMHYLFGSSVIGGLLLTGLPLLIIIGLAPHSDSRYARADISLTCFLLVYVLIHWLLAFPTWERYLLPLVPILTVLLGRILRKVAFWVPFVPSTWRFGLAGLLLVALLTVPAFQASAGCSPIDGERAAYEGMEKVVSFLARLSEGSVVYHHWLGWHYHYALWDAPVYLAYWPNPAWLARDVEVFGDREPRYIAFPGWESSARVERHLSGVGYGLDPVLSVAGSDGHHAFTVYQLVPSSDR